MIHSIQPGATLFITNADIVWTMIAACLVANVLRFAMMTAVGIEPLFTRPPSALFLVAAAVLLAWPFVSQWRARRRSSEAR